MVDYVANIVTVAEMQFYAGEGVDATGDVDANHIILQDHAEGYLSALLKFELSTTNWGTLNTTGKVLISEWAARFAAISLISYNMVGYSSRVEAEDMINVHWARMEQIEKILKEASIKDFLGA